MNPQPIDTAPRDGTEILVYFQGIGWKSVTWEVGDYGYGSWCVDDGKNGPFALRMYSTGGDTHWLPLPEEPE
jgi:hypothetical protein